MKVLYHESFEVVGVDLSALDLELCEGVVDLVAGELVAPRHQRVPEPSQSQNYSKRHDVTKPLQNDFLILKICCALTFLRRSGR